MFLTDLISVSGFLPEEGLMCKDCRNPGANVQFQIVVLRPCGFAFRGRRTGRRNLGRGSHFPLSAPLAAEMGAEKGAFLLSEFHIFVFLRPWPQIRAQNRAQN